MKRIFFIVFFIGSILNIYAQSSEYYIYKGNDALSKKDYQAALIWYSECLDSCNISGIQGLVKIWINQPSMRESMRLPLWKCLRCLKTHAENGIQDAMTLLSDFYSKGIGIEKDSVLANYWHEEWGKSLLPMLPENVYVRTDSSAIKTPRKSLLSNRFYSFLSYTYSPTMPVGFTAGIYFNKVGFYVSGRTSIESVNAAYECNNTRVPAIEIENPLYEFARERWYSQMITGGLMYGVVKNKLYLSVGGGYGIRDYYREIKSLSNQNFLTGNRIEWCYNTEASYKDWTIEAGGMFIWKKLTVLGGVNSTHFKDLDVYIGLGITF